MSMNSYENKQRLETDLAKVRLHFPSLVLKPGQFYTNRGEEQNLFNLDGTVPIMYKNNRYQIPVVIWLPLNYPAGAPFAYVVPTKDMLIRNPHRMVRPDGTCDSEYGMRWNQHTSDLFGFINDLGAAFSAEPPVYAKPPQSQQPVQPQRVDPVQTSPPGAFPAENPYGRDPPDDYYKQKKTEELARAKAQLLDKVRKTLAGFDIESTKEMEKLRTSQAALKKNSETLEQAETELTKILADLDKAKEDVAKEDTQLTLWLSERLDGPQFDPKTALTSVDPYALQLVDTVAEEGALEDVIYHLDSGLQKGLMDMETFLTMQRTTTREQFFKRALINKIIKEMSGGR